MQKEIPKDGPVTQAAKIRSFKRSVRTYHKQFGRHTLPWRRTSDPYHILISEVMLQQTQVDRVIPKYEHFIELWPTVDALAEAPLSNVLKAWQGLGYNSRAKRLRECARVVQQKYHGSFPNDFESLKALPGIGPYTAGAIMAFAFNKAVPIIETNIRTVYLHHFFPDTHDVAETELQTLIAKTLDKKEPRQWYAALMDYGAYLKKTYGNQNERSRSYAKQSTFKGSDRQLRGQLLRLAITKPFGRDAAHAQLSHFDKQRIDANLLRLCAEGLLVLEKGKYRLPD